MINRNFEKRFPFAYKYFSNLLNLAKENKKSFPQALIFEGEDTIGQYLFALELARNLNCLLNQDNDCTCTNCKWIKNHTHPAINNVSQLHFKPEGDETKTVISVKQALEIEKSLLLSSDYHRFFIFFSSQNKPLTQEECLEFDSFNYSNNIDYSIEPLNLKTFHPTTPNALLKSIEEPPKNTTFIFLTKSKENILQTIVSRCLTFKLSGTRKKIDYGNIFEFIKIYPDINYDNAFDISSNLYDFLSDSEKELDDILNEFLEFLKDMLKNNLSNQSLILKIRNDINLINNALKMKETSIQDKIILETLFLQIARGY